MSSERPHLGFVGPHLGHHPGWVITQSEILAHLFAGEGYTVSTTSSIEQPILRVADTLRSLLAWRLFARKKVDIAILSVFSGRAFHIADVTSRAAALLGLPQVHVLHGGALPELFDEKPVWARRVLARAARVVAPSPFLARAVGALPMDAEVIPNVLDLGAYPFEPRPLRGSTDIQPLEMLWLRTFHPIYRPLAALDVLAELRRRGVDARLTLAGQDKGLEGACRERAALLGLEDRVRFPGFLDAAGKRRELSRHDLYLHTNAVDNTPVTVLEAGAHGLPVVATAVGGLPDLIDHEHSGLLVEDGEDLAIRLADAALRLREDPALTERLSRGGRALAERCAWPRVHAEWRRLFGEISEKSPLT